jgi:CHAT domain-containing protein/Tfp pilus assembly protein PilF
MFTSILKRARPCSGLLHLTRLGFLVLLTLSLPTAIIDAQSDRDIHPLELHKAVERELAGGQSHSYRIVLTVGQYLHVIADQRGIDVLLALFGPDDKQVVEIDSLNGTQGPEPLSAIAESSGAYRLEVRSLEKDAPAGRYEVKIAELRKATEQDKIRIAAERAFAQAQLLYEQGTLESLRGAIKKYEEALSLYRALGDRPRESATLHNTGYLYYLLGEKQKALDHYAQALPLTRAVGDRDSEATVLTNIGNVYASFGDMQKALDYYRQALPIRRAVGDRRGEAITLSEIGRAHDNLGETQKALDYYAQALPLYRAVDDRGGEAAVLNGIGAVYQSLGERREALAYYGQALQIAHAVGNIRGEATVLVNIGVIYYSLGENQKALDYLTQALPLTRAIGDRAGEARAIHNIGVVYDELGEKQKALEYYERVLPLVRALRNVRGEATVLNNIATIYLSSAESQKALDYFARALALRRAVGDRGGEAATLQNIGGVYHALGEGRKALDYYEQALALVRLVGDRGSEATILANVGAAYSILGERRKALGYYAQALPLARAVGDRTGEATTLNNLMYVYDGLHSPRFAVLYGKQSVDAYQQLRSNIQGLDKDVQKTYLKSVERAYRGLADLLIRQGRPAEAQQVLSAFKEQQFFDFARTQSSPLKPLARTPREEEFASRYEKISDSLGAVGGQVADFKRKLGTREPNAQEAGQLQQLEAQLQSASKEFYDLLKQAETEFSKPADGEDKVSEISDTTQMQAVLRQLKKDTGQTAVAVYTLAGETKFHALIVTADDITSVSSAVRGDELNRKAREMWGLLQSDAYDPTILSHDLYNAVFKPVEEKLPKDTQTIMWSLDGNLRYVSMAALYDGRHYLIERYNHVNFTRADTGRMTRAVTKSWTATGLGVSVAHTVELLGNKITFGELPGVGEELRLLIRQRDNPQGIFEGEALQDENFTRAAMLSALRRKRPVVHIASHFSFRPGDEERSFLLVGDGTAFTLAEMKQQQGLFDGVELLTLSACNTAAQVAGADGREIDAFAELAQRLGANAVMATLWQVADSSTPWLMQEFYRTRQDQTVNKAEALRRAQLALLKGKAETTALPVTQRSGDNTRAELLFVDAKNAIPFKKEPRKPFAHPYYWSPFILVGNWR